MEDGSRLLRISPLCSNSYLILTDLFLDFNLLRLEPGREMTPLMIKSQVSINIALETDLSL